MGGGGRGGALPKESLQRNHLLLCYLVQLLPIVREGEWEVGREGEWEVGREGEWEEVGKEREGEQSQQSQNTTMCLHATHQQSPTN